MPNWRDRVHALAAAVAVMGFRAVLAVGAGAPHLFPDEIGYLGAARRIAGEGPPFALGPSPRYHPLYSALLAPVFLLTSSPSAAFVGVRVVNVLLGGVTAVLLYRCCRTVLGLDLRTAAGATVVAGVLASQSVHVVTAWAENLLAACVLLWVLAVHRVATGRSSAWWLVVVAALACDWTHPRGLLLVLVTAGAAAWIAVLRPRDRARAIACIGAVVFGAVVSRSAIAALLDPLYDAAATRQDGRTLDRLLDPGEWPGIGERLLGEAWYQAVGTAGLAVVGAVWLGRRAWQRRAREDVAPALLLVVVVGLAVVAAGYLGSGRADAAFHGRYVDAATPLLVAAGVAVVVRSWRAATGGVVAIAVLTIAMVAVVGSLDSSVPRVDDMVLGVAGHIAVVGLELVPVALVGMSIAAVAVGTAARWPAVGIGVLVVASGALAVQARGDRVDDFLRYGASLEDLAVAAAAHTDGAPVGIDLTGAPSEHSGTFGYQWFEPVLQAYAFDPNGDARSPWLIGPMDWDVAAAAGATLAELDPSRSVGLWVLPGADADRLRAAGAVLPSGFPVAFDAESTSARIVVREPSSSTLVVEVTHEGDRYRWPRFDPGGAGNATGRVRIGVAIGDRYVAADLPRDLLPGDTAAVTVDLAALVAELPAGDHEAVVDLFQVGYGWFRERGHPAATVSVTVPRRAAAR